MRVEKFEIVIDDDIVTADLHWADAPRTCQMISDLLSAGPLTDITNHAITAGHEFYVYCPAVDLPLENHVVRVDPGQLVYYFMPAGQNAGMPMHEERLGRRDIGEIALFYGTADLRIVTEANYRGNLFASVEPEDLERFHAMGRKTLESGRQQLTIRAGA